MGGLSFYVHVFGCISNSADAIARGEKHVGEKVNQLVGFFMSFRQRCTLQ